MFRKLDEKMTWVVVETLGADSAVFFLVNEKRLRHQRWALCNALAPRPFQFHFLFVFSSTIAPSGG